MSSADGRGDPGRRVAVVAYTEYPWDPRVRREAETFVEDGYVVHVIALRPRSGPSAAHIGGVHLHEVPLGMRRGGRMRYAYQYGTFLVLSTAILLRLHFRRPFDFVHVHSLPDFQVFCALPLKARRVPILLDLHEAMPEILAARSHLPLTALLPRVAALLEQLSCRFADHVVAANDGIRSAVISRGLPEGHVTSVYNPADVSAEHPSPEQLRRDLGLPDGRLIVHAAGINQERDLGTLLKALSRLRGGEDVHIVLAGDGEPNYFAALRQIASQLNLDERVHFVGRLSQAEARALMSLSEVGVVTLESNPLTDLAWPTRIPEFAAMGKPLVVPRLHFLASLLQDAVQYYSPGDADSLAHELDVALALGREVESSTAKAQRICLRFEPRRMREALRGVYRILEESHA